MLNEEGPRMPMVMKRQYFDPLGGASLGKRASPFLSPLLLKYPFHSLSSDSIGLWA